MLKNDHSSNQEVRLEQMNNTALPDRQFSETVEKFSANRVTRIVGASYTMCSASCAFIEKFHAERTSTSISRCRSLLVVFGRRWNFHGRAAFSKNLTANARLVRMPLKWNSIYMYSPHTTASKSIFSISPSMEFGLNYFCIQLLCCSAAFEINNTITILCDDHWTVSTIFLSWSR